MEDASKALIMAASVLIGIIILSLGAYLFATFSSHTKVVAQEYELNKIKEFNNQFTKYEGIETNTIYDVVSIINAAKENNTISSNIVKVKLSEKYVENENSLNELINNDTSLITSQNPKLKTYIVECVIDENTGYVKEVKIIKN